MTEKELDSEYIGRQANEIKNLEAENKTLKERRDELLEAVCQSEIVFRNIGHKEKAEMLVPIILKALKEKEGNE